MLRSLNELHNYQLNSPDDRVGKVDDLLFDDHEWTIRYLVANTGSRLNQWLVLLSPANQRQSRIHSGCAGESRVRVSLLRLLRSPRLLVHLIQVGQRGSRPNPRSYDALIPAHGQYAAKGVHVSRRS